MLWKHNRYIVLAGVSHTGRKGKYASKKFRFGIFFSFVHIKLVKLPGLLLLKLSVHLDRNLIRRNLNSR